MSIFTQCFSRKKRNVKLHYSAHENLKERCRPVSEMDDPHMDYWVEQFSAGDQTKRSRIAFWNAGMGVCVKCGEKNMRRYEEKAGVRQNGDSYGTEVFKCKTKDCHWATSYKFDDADPLHYTEVKDWPRGLRYFPRCYMKHWAAKHHLPSHTKRQMHQFHTTGNRLLDSIEKDTLLDDLNIGKKEAARLVKIVKDPQGHRLV